MALTGVPAAARSAAVYTATPTDSALWQNPHFIHDAQHLPHSARPSHFWRRSLTLLIGMLLGVLALYIVYMLDDWLLTGRVQPAADILILAAWISVLLLPVLDSAAARAGRLTLRHHLADSPPPPTPDELGAYLRGRHGLAQVLSWRLTLIFVGVRLALVGLIGLAALFVTASGAAPEYVLLLEAMARAPSSPPLLIAAALTLAALFVIEPVGRLRVMTAWGLHDAAHPDLPPRGLAHWLALPLLTWLLSLGVYLLLHRLLLGDYNPTAVRFYLLNSRSFGNDYDPTRAVGDYAVLAPLIAGLALAYGAALLAFWRAAPGWLLRRTAGHLTDASTLAQARARALHARQQGDAPAPHALPGPLTRLIGWMAPFGAAWDNPLLRLEARRLPCDGRRAGLLAYSLRLLRRSWLIGLLLIGFWVLLRWPSLYEQYIRWSQQPDRVVQALHTLLVETGTLALLFSIGVSLFMDGASILSSLNTINQDMIAGRWDLLRTTLVREGDLIAGRHALTQLRTWRSTLFVFGVRLMVLLIGALLFVLNTPYNPGFSPLQGIAEEVITQPHLVALVVYWLALTLWVYLSEPFWRRRTLTLVGMANSVGRDTSYALLLGFASVVGSWIGLVMLLGVILYSYAGLQDTLLRVLVGDRQNYMVNLSTFPVWQAWQMLGFIVLPLVLATAIYAYYRLLAWRATQAILRRAFKG